MKHGIIHSAKRLSRRLPLIQSLVVACLVAVLFSACDSAVDAELETGDLRLEAEAASAPGQAAPEGSVGVAAKSGSVVLAEIPDIGNGYFTGATIYNGSYWVTYSDGGLGDVYTTVYQYDTLGEVIRAWATLDDGQEILEGLVFSPALGGFLSRTRPNIPPGHLVRLDLPTTTTAPVMTPIGPLPVDGFFWPDPDGQTYYRPSERRRLSDDALLATYTAPGGVALHNFAATVEHVYAIGCDPNVYKFAKDGTFLTSIPLTSSLALCGGWLVNAFGVSEDGSKVIYWTSSHGGLSVETLGEPTPTNQPPSADTGGPYSGTAGQPVAFSGSGSTDSDGSVASWAWDFGDGNSGAGTSPSHTYAAAGNYTVTLTVTDDDGATGQASTSASISPATVPNQPPSANAGGPYFGTAGQAVSFDGTGSSDSDGSVVSFAWNFGDGSTGTGASPSHTYAAAGSYTVTLTVTDDDGATDQATSSAMISAAPVPNQLPSANAGGPYFGTAGQAVSFDGSASSDSDGSIVSFAWDFGDGGTGTGASPSHTYATAGNFTVTLTVTDDDGATGQATSSAMISPVPNVAPTAHAGGPYSGTAGEAIAFDGSGSSDSDGSVVSYAWDFGDGSTGTGASPSHTYATAGSYTVTLTVTDDDGATGQATASVSVVAAPPPPPPPPPPTGTVTIDILPGSSTNPFNMKAKGTLPVAIMSSASFDAAAINLASVRLGSVGIAVKNNGTFHAALEDVDRDGRRDLVIHVDRQALVSSGSVTRSTIQLTLTGTTNSGAAFQGTDQIEPK